MQDEKNITPPPRREDLFDKILALRPFRFLQPFYQKHREGLLYLFFGGVTTVVSWGSFLLFHSLLLWNEHTANILSWILAVLVAFLTNRRWVFCADEKKGGSFLFQMLTFYASRLSTLGCQELLLLIFVTLIGWAAIPVRAAAEIIVLLLNYVLSKFLIFKKGNKEE